MKKKFFFVVSVIIIIFIFIISTAVYLKEMLSIDGWNQFKKGAVDGYTFVDNVRINRGIPLKLEIEFNVNHKLDDNEIDELFNYALNYISNEKTFSDLVKYKKRWRKYSFHIFGIRIYYSDNGNPHVIDLTSHQSETGEPKFEYYKEWDIYYYHNGVSKEYTTLQ